MLTKLFDKLMGLPTTPEDLKLMEQINNTYKSARVSGRGALHVDVKEVTSDPAFQKMKRDLAKLAK